MLLTRRPVSRKGKKWKHEDASEMMFDDMIRQYNLGISEQDATFIKALIAGDKTRCACVFLRVIPLLILMACV